MHISQHRWCICICTSGKRTNKHISLLLLAIQRLISRTPYSSFLPDATPFHWAFASPQYLYQNSSGKETELKCINLAPYGSSRGKGSWEKEVKTIIKIWRLFVDLNYPCSSYFGRPGMINSWLPVNFDVGQTVKLVDPQGNPSLWPLTWVTCMGFSAWCSERAFKLQITVSLSPFWVVSGNAR